MQLKRAVPPTALFLFVARPDSINQMPTRKDMTLAMAVKETGESFKGKTSILQP
jgi:hypothetical protein